MIPTIQPRSFLGAYVGLNVSGTIKQANMSYNEYNKKQFNGGYPSFKDIDYIANHLRVFHSDCYKLIPQHDLRSIHNIYLNDSFTFQ